MAYSVVDDLAFINRYAEQRSRAWVDIEAFFGGLPPSLDPIVSTFSRRFAREVSPTGLFKDSFSEPIASRVVYFPIWHIQSYLRQNIAVADPEILQKDLFVSSFLGACAIRIYDDLIDRDHLDGLDGELLLANLCTMEATGLLRRSFPAQSPLWSYFNRYWRDYSEAVGGEWQRNSRGLPRFDLEDLRLFVGNKAALLKIYPVAVAMIADRERDIERLEAMMDAFNIASQLSNDISGLRRNVEFGQYTYPIARAALAAGCDFGSQPAPDIVYGSLLFGDALNETCSLAIEYYQQVLDNSAELGFADINDCARWQVERLREVDRSLNDGDWDGGLPAGHRSAAPATPERPDSLDMALMYLQYDLEFKESWELQHTNLWQRTRLVGDIFSRSVILEALAEQERAPLSAIEDLLTAFQQTGWRHYRDFEAIPPDIDNLAQAIRLAVFTTRDKAMLKAYLQEPLGWLEANRTSDGGFRVWLVAEECDLPEEIVLDGFRCIAAEANLLAALAAYPAVSRREWILEGVSSLLDRWQKQGDTAAYYYRPSYARLLIARCLVRVKSLPWVPDDLSASLQRQIVALSQEAATSGSWDDSLEVAANILVCLYDPEPARVYIRDGLKWLEGRQSFDGGWERSAFYRCPGMPGQDFGWHGGRMLTTAVVASALAKAQGHPGDGF